MTMAMTIAKTVPNDKFGAVFIFEFKFLGAVFIIVMRRCEVVCYCLSE